MGFIGFLLGSATQSKLASWGSRGLDRSEGWLGLEGNMSRFETAEKIVDSDAWYSDGGALEL
jgi:hypothetical protein